MFHQKSIKKPTMPWVFLLEELVLVLNDHFGCLHLTIGNNFYQVNANTIFFQIEAKVLCTACISSFNGNASCIYDHDFRLNCAAEVNRNLATAWVWINRCAL